MPTFSFQKLASPSVLSNYAFFHEGFVHTAGLTTTGGAIYLVNGLQGIMSYKEVANQLVYLKFTPFMNMDATEVIGGIEYFANYYYVYTNLNAYVFPVSALLTALSTPNLPQITLTNLNLPMFTALNSNTMAIDPSGTVYIATALASGASTKVAMSMGRCLPNGTISSLINLNAPGPTLTDIGGGFLYVDDLIPLNGGYMAAVRDTTLTPFSTFNVLVNTANGAIQETATGVYGTFSSSVGQPVMRGSYTGPIGFASRLSIAANSTTIINGRPNRTVLGMKGYRLDTGYKAVNNACCNSYNNLYVFNIEDTGTSTVLNLVASTPIVMP
jgi:hypothetical protein